MPDVPFSSLAAFRQRLAAAPTADTAARTGAQARNGQLTKPPGALGRLEELAIWYAGWRGNPRPQIERPQVIVFAGNHGVTAQGVSAFPPEVTVQMVSNFEAGGAAVNQLAKLAGARMDVHALALDRPTADFTKGPAMSEAEVIDALGVGWTAVGADTDLLVVGEMGIGNTTAAAALAHALFGGAPVDWVGRGTGVGEVTLGRKRDAVAAGLALHQPTDADAALRTLGGYEIAALVGAMEEARARGIAVNQQSELFIQGRDGQIRERNSYGNDPYPPKG